MHIFSTRHLPTAICGILLTAATLVLTSCNSGNSSADNVPDSEHIAISDIGITIMDGSKSYKITSEDSDFYCFLTLSASIQWPYKIDVYNIRELQEEIIRRAFPDAKSVNPVKVLKEYMDNPQSFELGDNSIAIDKVPDEPDLTVDYYNNVRTQMLEIDDVLATFNVSATQYLGGAHPNTVSSPFTYLLSDNQVVDNRFLFKNGYEQTLLNLLKETIAAQLNMSEEELSQALLNGFVLSECVYILDGMIVYHYNTYELLPYSYGAIDAQIPPYLMEEYLTDNAKALLYH